MSNDNLNQTGAVAGTDSSNTNSNLIAQDGDIVYVHYTGTFQDGTKFDSSYDRGEPLQLVLGARQVIPGWEKGLRGLREGEKKRLVIAPEDAYGAAGIKDQNGNVIIPENATLIFDVEMVKIVRQAQ